MRTPGGIQVRDGTAQQREDTIKSESIGIQPSRSKRRAFKTEKEMKERGRARPGPSRLACWPTGTGLKSPKTGRGLPRLPPAHSHRRRRASQSCFLPLDATNHLVSTPYHLPQARQSCRALRVSLNSAAGTCGSCMRDDAPLDWTGFLAHVGDTDRVKTTFCRPT